jgi:DNA repair exonuclease SbcCD ATPase subunit
MSEDSQTYVITNVEGVKELTLELQPGVNLLTGENGAGKTSAIRAMTRAAGDQGVTLEKRDGTKKGSVRGPGVVLSVGARTTTTGQPTVDLADYGCIGRLIEPPVKGQKARDKARLQAIAEMYDFRATEEELLALSGGNEEIAGAVQGKKDGKEMTLLEAAEEARKMAHAVARDYETRRDESKGRIDGAKALLAKHDEVTGDIMLLEEAEMQLEAAIKHAAVIARSFEDAEKFRAEREKVKAGLVEVPDVAEIHARYKTKHEEVEAAISALDEMKAELMAIAAEGKAAKQMKEEADRQREILERPIDATNGQDVADAQRKVEELKYQVELSRETEEVRRLKKELGSEAEQFNLLDGKADEMRELAQGVPRVTSKLLEKRGLGDLVIDEGRLSVVDKDGVIQPFERLSQGQKAKVALDIACQAYPGKTVPVEPEFWLTLQPAFRKEFAKLAADKGLFVVTEEATDEPGVTLEHLTGNGD